jgi:hypothetical protein
VCIRLFGGIINISLFLLCRATIMTLNGFGINVPFGLLVIPLLVPGLPNLPLTAVATSERLIEIKLRQTPVRVNVRELAVVSRYSRRMTSLLCRSDPKLALRRESLLQSHCGQSVCACS